MDVFALDYYLADHLVKSSWHPGNLPFVIEAFVPHLGIIFLGPWGLMPMEWTG